MNDRDRDSMLLSLMGGGRRLPGHIVLAFLTCTVCAFVSARRDVEGGIMGILLLSLANVFILIQYSVSGPLIREIQRLRADLDEVRGQKQSG